ncbi:MAG: hypothetical protein WC647_03995 [Desulfomonilaceae bacterium]
MSMKSEMSMFGVPHKRGYGSLLTNSKDYKVRYAGKISNAELKTRVKTDLITPYHNVVQPDNGIGSMTMFEEFIQTRPDGGQIFLSQKGEPLTWADLLEAAGIDPIRESFNSLAALSDDFRYLFGPLVSDIFTKGFSQTPAGSPPLWQQLCFQVGVPSQFPAIRKAWFTFQGQPIATAEGENFPESRISQGTEEIRFSKFGTLVRLTEEYIKANPLAITESWLTEMGRVYQALEDGRAVDCLAAGDLSTGANAAPVIGVSDPTVGIDYVDLVRCWIKGQAIGERYFTIVAGEEMSNKLAAIDEFKERQVGTSQVALVNRPEPSQVERYVSPHVPDNQLIVVDTSHALRQRNFIPITVDRTFRPESWERGIVIGYQSGYERVADKAVVIIDETKAYADYQFPSWFVVGGYRQ